MDKFADLADEADRIQSALLEMKIFELRQRSKELNLDNESGLCWYCDSETGIARRFCNKECASSWSREHE